MNFGNMPADNGFLILNEFEMNELIRHNPQAINFIKKLIGAQEFIRGEIRYCLWIDKSILMDALKIPEIKVRVDEVRKERAKSSRPQLALTPYSFAQITAYPSNSQIIVPRVSSESRDYLPIGYLGEDTIISDSALVISDSKPWLLSILNSKIHMVWLRSIGGKLETRYRYSKDIVYNSFPFPTISNQRKEELTKCTFRILEEREKHPEKTLAELYDPDKMPEGLKEAHRFNDEAVERCYKSTPFNSDEERLEYLFKLYEKMIQEEKEKGTLFEAEKKTRKKK
jgi:hypothetical protein